MEEQKREEAKKRQQEYCESLNAQMEEARKRKRYGELMTEHERRVNDRDIKAYVEGDRGNIYSKVPGVKGHDSQVQERYIDKIFS